MSLTWTVKVPSHEVVLRSSHSDFPKENITFKEHLFYAQLVSIKKT